MLQHQDPAAASPRLLPRVSEQVGRYLAASRCADIGDVLLSETAARLLVPQNDTTCVWCLCPQPCAAACTGQQDLLPLLSNEFSVLPAGVHPGSDSVVDDGLVFLVIRLILAGSDVLSWLLDHECFPLSSWPERDVVVHAAQRVWQVLPPAARSFFHDDVMVLARAHAAFRVNAMEVGEEDAAPLLAMFATACLLQHACVPNAWYTTGVYQSSASGVVASLELRACARIAASMPVSISYLPMYRCVAERRSTLQRVYGFHCQCRHCSVLPDATLAYRCSSNCDRVDDAAALVALPDQQSGLICLACRRCVSSQPPLAARDLDRLTADPLRALHAVAMRRSVLLPGHTAVVQAAEAALPELWRRHHDASDANAVDAIVFWTSHLIRAYQQMYGEWCGVLPAFLDELAAALRQQGRISAAEDTEARRRRMQRVLCDTTEDGYERR